MDKYNFIIWCVSDFLLLPDLTSLCLTSKKVREDVPDLDIILKNNVKTDIKRFFELLEDCKLHRGKYINRVKFWQIKTFRNFETVKYQPHVMEEFKDNIWILENYKEHFIEGIKRYDSMSRRHSFMVSILVQYRYMY